MQTALGRHHDTVKDFGQEGNPIHSCFTKKLKQQRVKEHTDFLFDEKFGVSDDVSIEELKEVAFKNGLKSLRTRGYHIE